MVLPIELIIAPKMIALLPITLYLGQTGLSKIEPVTCKILTFLPKNTGIELKAMHARGIYGKVGQVT